MKRRIVLVAILVVGLLGIGGAVFVVLQYKAPEPAPVVEQQNFGPRREVIGTSVQGRPIEEYTYGNGDTTLLFIGGIHGGYEWNSVLLAYTFMDYIDANPGIIPDNLTVTVIPDANPDGVYAIIGKEGRFELADVPVGDASAGRFNAHDVDLNRNFNCNWQPEATWRGNAVSAGTAPFSEPEAAAIRDFVTRSNPAAVVMWHSQANAVYPSECGGEIAQETRDIMNAYATAAGYQVLDTFDDYEVTGSADGWLALLNIPALTVELQTHDSIEWDRNLSGIEALLEYYGQEAE